MEAEWRVFLWKFNRSPIFGCGGGRNRGKEFADSKGASEIGTEIVGQRILFPGVCRDTVSSDRNRTRGVKK